MIDITNPELGGLAHIQLSKSPNSITNNSAGLLVLATAIRSGGYDRMAVPGPEHSLPHLAMELIVQELGVLGAASAASLRERHADNTLAVEHLAERWQEPIVIERHGSALDALAATNDLDEAEGSTVAALPVTNTLTGPITLRNPRGRRASVLDHIRQTDVTVLGTVAVPTTHALYEHERSGTGSKRGRTVLADTLTLDQCSRRLKSLGLRPVNVAEQSSPLKALNDGKLGWKGLVIAPAEAATHYPNVSVLKDSIGDMPPGENMTTLALVAREGMYGSRIKQALWQLAHNSLVYS